MKIIHHFQFLIVYFLFPLFVVNAQFLERSWVKEYSGDFAIQVAKGISADNSGNAYVGIRSFDIATDYGYTVIKYGPDGDTLWVAKYDDENPEVADRLYNLTSDLFGNVYLTGTSEYRQTDPYLHYFFYLTIKYNADGKKQWMASYD